MLDGAFLTQRAVQEVTKRRYPCSCRRWRVEHVEEFDEQYPEGLDGAGDEKIDHDSGQEHQPSPASIRWDQLLLCLLIFLCNKDTASFIPSESLNPGDLQSGPRGGIFFQYGVDWPLFCANECLRKSNRYHIFALKKKNRRSPSVKTRFVFTGFIRPAKKFWRYNVKEFWNENISFLYDSLRTELNQISRMSSKF